jgi:hypothetical protein
MTFYSQDTPDATAILADRVLRDLLDDLRQLTIGAPLSPLRGRRAAFVFGVASWANHCPA